MQQRERYIVFALEQYNINFWMIILRKIGKCHFEEHI